MPCSTTPCLALLLAAACGGTAASGGGDDDHDDVDARRATDAARPDAPSFVPATHFAATAVGWSVPGNGLGSGFDRPLAFASTRFWTTTDLDDDGRLDLVQTGDTTASQRVLDAASAPYWKVFANVGGGPAATAPSSGWSPMSTPTVAST